MSRGIDLIARLVDVPIRKLGTRLRYRNLHSPLQHYRDNIRCGREHLLGPYCVGCVSIASPRAHGAPRALPNLGPHCTTPGMSQGLSRGWASWASPLEQKSKLDVGARISNSRISQVPTPSGEPEGQALLCSDNKEAPPAHLPPHSGPLGQLSASWDHFLSFPCLWPGGRIQP